MTEATAETAAPEKQTRGFETEVRQLLDLMVNSLYSDKEIFLRELISNASDAADKLRFEALRDDALFEGDGALRVEVEVDKDARTLTVRDNGIGMSFDEVIENIGTIARSGTRRFFESLTGDQAVDAQLIGQFGVGFYSSFIVADEVTVNTRKAGADAGAGVRWTSKGDGEYDIEPIERATRGTEVILHLKEGEDELLETYRVRGIVTRYSDHLSLPVNMRKPPEPAAAQDNDDEKADDDAEQAEATPEPEEAWETVNEAQALWTRSRGEIEEAEYNAFYKHVAHDFEDPLAHVHSRVEGNLEYTALLFVPQRAPFDLWDRSSRKGVKLYVRRVFIMDDAENLMPPYLRFVRGVIDSADLPLNVSREILQQNRQIDQIRGGAVRRVLDMLKGLAEGDDDAKAKYATFWEQFGRVMKEGVIDDPKNKVAVAKLMRFASTKGDGEKQVVSFEDYVERMVDGQDTIYYITADNYLTARNSPHLEALEAKGVEVLLLTDEIDEWMVQHLGDFDGKHLKSVAKGAIDVDKIGTAKDESSDDEGSDDKSDDDDKAGKKKDVEGEDKAITERLGKVLDARVKEVRATARLTTSPACLVADEYDMGAHMERVLRAAGQDVGGSKPILEYNPTHPMLGLFADEQDEARAGQVAELLFEQALLAEGGKLEDPAGFVRRMNGLLLDLAGRK